MILLLKRELMLTTDFVKVKDLTTIHVVIGIIAKKILTDMIVVPIIVVVMTMTTIVDLKAKEEITTRNPIMVTSALKDMKTIVDFAMIEIVIYFQMIGIVITVTIIEG